MGREQRQQQKYSRGNCIQRSQSRSSLSASFKALAGYFPCMNSLEEDKEKVCGEEDLKVCQDDCLVTELRNLLSYCRCVNNYRW